MNIGSHCKQTHSNHLIRDPTRKPMRAICRAAKCKPISSHCRCRGEALWGNRALSRMYVRTDKSLAARQLLQTEGSPWRRSAGRSLGEDALSVLGPR
eukprot:1693291-Amphidinium_carterae.1